MLDGRSGWRWPFFFSFLWCFWRVGTEECVTAFISESEGCVEEGKKKKKRGPGVRLFQLEATPWGR